MVDIGIFDIFGITTRLEHLVAQDPAVPGPDLSVIGTGRKPQRRRIRADKIDRLGHFGLLIITKALFRGFGIKRIEIIGPGQRRHASDQVRRLALATQPLPVERQHHRIISAGGLSGQEYPIRITAMLANMVMHPGKRFGAVFEKTGKAGIRE